jgi:hypothetical protein
MIKILYLPLIQEYREGSGITSAVSIFARVFVADVNKYSPKAHLLQSCWSKLDKVNNFSASCH